MSCRDSISSKNTTLKQSSNSVKYEGSLLNDSLLNKCDVTVTESINDANKAIDKLIVQLDVSKLDLKCLKKDDCDNCVKDLSHLLQNIIDNICLIKK